MTGRHCIEKILEKTKQPSSADDIEELQSTANANEFKNRHATKLEDRKTNNRRLVESKRNDELDERAENRFLLQFPREPQRQLVNEHYRSFPPSCCQRIQSCHCPGCVRERIPPWMMSPPSPTFITLEKRMGPQAIMRHPYLARHEREYATLSNNQIATRPKHQSSSISTGGPRKKKRHRTAFTPTQLLGLENAFEQSHYSVGEERKQLAGFLSLSETQIKVWFQNRRTKHKRIRREAEEEYSGNEDMADGDHRSEIDYSEPHRSYYDECYRDSRIVHGHDKCWSIQYPWPGDKRFPLRC